MYKKSNIAILAEKCIDRKKTLESDLSYVKEQFEKLGKDPERIHKLSKGQLYTLFEIFEMMDGKREEVFRHY